ncbi:MAG: hypothetical protein KDC91_02230 [Flavobacteriaceae bacterium]|nr:hypothetical protein [Flavobacteriaceae bacterium]
MGLHKIIKIIALLLSVVGIVFFVMILSAGDKAIAAGESGGTVNGALYTAYIIFGLVLAAVLIFVLKGVFAGDIKKTLITVGAFLAIVLIGYVMASGNTEGLPLVDNQPVTESTSKWVGTGLNTFYILALLAIGAMILSGLKRVAK